MEPLRYLTRINLYTLCFSARLSLLIFRRSFLVLSLFLLKERKPAPFQNKSQGFTRPENKKSLLASTGEPRQFICDTRLLLFSLSPTFKMFPLGRREEPSFNGWTHRVEHPRAQGLPKGSNSFGRILSPGALLYHRGVAPRVESQLLLATVAATSDRY